MNAEEWAEFSEAMLHQRRALIDAFEAAGMKVMESTAYGAYDGIHVYRSKKRTYVDFWLRDGRDTIFGCIVHWGQKEYPRSYPPEGIAFANQARRILENAGLDDMVEWKSLDELNDTYARRTGTRLDRDV